MPIDGSDPVYNYKTIEKELAKYDQDLADKPRILAINKVDLLSDKDRDKSVKGFIKSISYSGEAYSISALNGMGCKELVYGLFHLTKIS